MGQQVVMGAMLQCSFGVAPCPLAVIPTSKVFASKMPAATIMDNKIVNIPNFGMCNTESNPAVAAATAAKLGVKTPAPCVPFILAPWAPGSSTVKIGNIPALNNNSKCNCNWGGVISITYAGQTTVNIP